MLLGAIINVSMIEVQAPSKSEEPKDQESAEQEPDQPSATTASLFDEPEPKTEQKPEAAVPQQNSAAIQQAQTYVEVNELANLRVKDCRCLSQL